MLETKRRRGEEEREGGQDTFTIGSLLYIHQSRTNEIIEITPINIT